MRIAVYAQSGTEIGMGHVVRTAHLIDLFKARGHHVDIITNNDGQRYFKSRGHGSVDAKDTKVVMEAELAVVDHMITDNAYLQMIRPGVRKLVVIVGAGHTITPETRWVADLVIYQCPRLNKLHNIVPGEHIISGFDYLILHPKYAKAPEDEFRYLDFMTYFGGGTREGFENNITLELRKKGYTVGWATDSPGWLTDLYDPLSHAKSFVGTMGMVAYEALATYTHPIIFCRSTDHLEIAEHLQKYCRDGTNLGMLPQRPIKVDKYIDRIIDAYENRPPCWRRKVDGKGAYRVAREILKC